jgi:hypothetical protein
VWAWKLKRDANLAIIRYCPGIKTKRDAKSRSKPVLWGIKTEKRHRISQQYGTEGALNWKETENLAGSRYCGAVKTEKRRKNSQQLGTVGQQNWKQTQNPAAIRYCRALKLKRDARISQQFCDVGALKLKRDAKSRNNTVLWGNKTENRGKISRQWYWGGGAWKLKGDAKSRNNGYWGH